MSGAKKILLVDDSNTALMMERLIFQSHPWQILTAKDGLEAVEKATAEQPNLILMDVVMPRLDGLAALKQLRAQDKTRHIPIIMISVRTDGLSMEMAFRYGATDYVQKPVNGAELLLKVRALLG